MLCFAYFCQLIVQSNVSINRVIENNSDCESFNINFEFKNYSYITLCISFVFHCQVMFCSIQIHYQTLQRLYSGQSKIKKACKKKYTCFAQLALLFANHKLVVLHFRVLNLIYHIITISVILDKLVVDDYTLLVLLVVLQ